jgi:hypothetical protein
MHLTAQPYPGYIVLIFYADQSLSNGGSCGRPPLLRILFHPTGLGSQKGVPLLTIPQNFPSLINQEHLNS